MGKKIKLVASLVVFCMLLSMLPVTPVEEYDASEKIGEDLLEQMGISYEELASGDYVDSGETYSCIIWLNDAELEEAVDAGIDAAEMTREDKSFWSKSNTSYSTYEVSGLTYVDVEMEDDVSDEYVQTYIEEEREVAVELYSENNNNFVAENFMARDMSVTYVSKYSPCVFADLSVSKIAELIENDEVCRIGYISEEMGTDLGYYGDGTLSTQQVQQAMEVVRVDDAKTDFNVTGDGIKIGQIEYYCPDVESVILHPNTDELVEDDEHADNVYTIMKETAPDATYYATGIFVHPGQFFGQIEWLLDQGVNIINFSAALSEAETDVNVYTEEARWLDHIAFNHDVHFVMASGRSMIPFDELPNGVPSPGMAYNIITVGSARLDITTYAREQMSSYNNEETLMATYKPDITAPGYYNANMHGTSYAAPLVSGVIALMCEYRPSLKVQQHIVKAILAATTSKTIYRYVTTDDEFVQYGAGMMDARAAIYAIYKGNFSTSTGALQILDSAKLYTMNVTSNDTVMRVALAYANRIEYDTDDGEHSSTDIPMGYIGKLDLTVYDPYGNLVASLYSSDLKRNANLKVLEFEPNGVYGNYTIKVTVAQRAVYSDNTTINFGVAWR